MAIASGQKILYADIINRFVSDVTQVVLQAPIVHSGNVVTYNVPRTGAVPVVPVNLLGHLSEIPTPSIVGGAPGNRVNAKELYDAMVYVTTILTRVGTYQFDVYFGTDSGYHRVNSVGGKALFNASYMRTLPAVGNGGVAKGNKITAQNLIALFQNCLSAWQNTDRHHNIHSARYCHSSCHSSCHSYCHTNVDCHVDCHDPTGWLGVCHTDHKNECDMCQGSDLGIRDGEEIDNPSCHGNTPGCYSNGCNSACDVSNSEDTGVEFNQNTNMDPGDPEYNPDGPSAG